MNVSNHKLKIRTNIAMSKTLKTLFCLAIFSLTFFTTYAQTAEEIVDTYIENIGGQEAWSKINSMTASGIAKQGGTDYPFVATYMKDGRTHIVIDLQGQKYTVEAFDGETEWAMNFQTQKPEAADSESSLNYKNDAKDNIVDPFFNYKEKGYKIELLGKEVYEGTDCFKIKLTKSPAIVDGKEVDNIEMYYFDTENFVPIASESTILSGPAKGATQQSLYSDYQEVDGLYLYFSLINKFNGQVGLEMNIDTVKFNSTIDDTIFTMPEKTLEKKN